MHYSTPHPRTNGILDGPLDNARAAMPMFLPSGAILTMNCYCSSAKYAVGMKPGLMKIIFPDYGNLIQSILRLITTQMTDPLSGQSSAISGTFAMTDPGAWSDSIFSAKVDRCNLLRAARRCPSRTPFLCAHGATGFVSAHKPNRPAFAARSNSANPYAVGAYRLYHHANPSPTIMLDTSPPSGRRTLTTSRAYLSGPMLYAVTPGTASNSPNRLRAALNAICPFSGASMPHNRNITTFPCMSFVMMVSPSQTRSMERERFFICFA